MITGSFFYVCWNNSVYPMATDIRDLGPMEQLLTGTRVVTLPRGIVVPVEETILEELAEDMFEGI